MGFQDRIDGDLREALKARQADRLGVLRMLKSALKYAALEKGGATAQLDDPEALAVIRKQIKQRQDAVEGFDKGNRPELAAKERAELEILHAYLPAEMDPAELQSVVSMAIREADATSPKQMGAVMKIAQAKAAGRVEGKMLSQEVQRQLAAPSEAAVER